MKTRQLGASAVSELGFGCMNLSHAYATPPSAEQARAVLQRALDLGVTHFDTAALYGFGRNEELVGAALKPIRRRLFLASKCGMTGEGGKRVIDGRPETLRRTCGDSLRRLQTDVIDLYYLHRWDKSVPIEESIGALADLARAGWIRGIGLSEVSAATLRKAHAVHPIAAVQSEYSLWTRNPELGVLKACNELGVAFVAFSPLGRGFLAGPIEPAAFNARDIRRAMPRFCEPHFANNCLLFERFAAIAAKQRCTPAQLALGWLLHKDPRIIPIPGTTTMSHLEENLRAAEVQFDPALLREADACVGANSVGGARYSLETQKEIDTEDR